MNFGEALTLLKAGHKVNRNGWNGKGMWLFFIPASHWETTRGLEMLEGRPWVGIKTVDDQFMPWVASQSDMLADDWMEYKEPVEEKKPKTLILNDMQVKALKGVGVWKTEPPVVEQHKKPHWTQTPAGKKIMAKRRTRGSKK